MAQKTKSLKKRKKIRTDFSKKSLSNFLTEEEGKIAKNNLTKLGLIVVVSAIAAAGAMKAKNVSATSAHSNHASHGSHSSHWNSHGSHGAHNSSW